MSNVPEIKAKGEGAVTPFISLNASGVYQMENDAVLFDAIKIKKGRSVFINFFVLAGETSSPTLAFDIYTDDEKHTFFHVTIPIIKEVTFKEANFSPLASTLVTTDGTVLSMKKIA